MGKHRSKIKTTTQTTAAIINKNLQSLCDEAPAKLNRQVVNKVNKTIYSLKANKEYEIT